MISRDNSGRQGFLDGWRAIAVSIVIVSHFSFRPEPWLKSILGLFPPAMVGVYIFFFISGYVVTRVTLGEIAYTGKYSIYSFYRRRFFRIVPPLLIYVLTCIFLDWLGVVYFPFLHAISSVFYLCNVAPLANCGWIGGHTWSLAFEEQFYLLFPAAVSVALLGRKNLLAPLFVLAILCLAPMLWPINFVGRTGFLVIYGLFAAGALCAGYYGRVERFLARAPATFTGIAVIFTFVIPIWISAAGEWLKYYQFIFVVSIPVIVLGSGMTRKIRLILEDAFLSYIGRVSYSIYLWQQLATSDGLRTQPIWVEILAIAMVVPLSIALYEGVERHLIAYARRPSGAH